MTMTDEREVLSALIDREPVDPDVLARVLQDPANRALLVDFVRLRASVNEGSEPVAGSSILSPPAVPRRQTAQYRQRWFRVAAAVLLLAVAAGGGAWLQYALSIERPPQPDRVVRLEQIERQ
jgi:hypothetical protein